MKNIIIMNKPLWLRAGRHITPADCEKKAACFKLNGLEKYSGSTSTDWCVEFFVERAPYRGMWISLKKLNEAVKAADLHMRNPQVLMRLVDESDIRDKTNTKLRISKAIQDGDYS